MDDREATLRELPAVQQTDAPSSPQHPEGGEVAPTSLSAESILRMGEAPPPPKEAQAVGKAEEKALTEKLAADRIKEEIRGLGQDIDERKNTQGSHSPWLRVGLGVFFSSFCCKAGFRRNSISGAFRSNGFSNCPMEFCWPWSAGLL